MEKRVVGLPWISRPDHCSKFKYPKNKELGNGGRPSGRPRGERMRSGGGLVGSPTESTLCVRHSNRVHHLYCVPLSPCMHHTPSFLEWSETLKGGLYGCSVKKKPILQIKSNLVIFGVALRQKYAFVQKSAACLVCYGSELPKKIYVNHQTLGRFEAL